MATEPLPATPPDAASEPLIPPESSTGVVLYLTDGGGAVHTTCSTERMAEARASLMASGADRISNLPEGVLHHILSQLPARDAVRTCILAQSWRNRWRSAPALRIAWSPGSHGVDGAFGRFVDALLRFRRGGAPLDFCDFDLEVDPGSCNFYDLQMHGNSWIRRMLELTVRELRFRVYCHSEYPGMYDFSPLSSQHLTSLELTGVTQFDTGVLHYDFSGCSALESLRMEDCPVDSTEMHSPSLKHLSIKKCRFDFKSRIWMSFPSLVSFEFTNNFGRAPMLERMPHLEAVKVQFDLDCYDRCKNGRLDDCGDADCSGCSSYPGPRGSGCVFLRGLVQATSLNLSAHPHVYVFSRDLKWCPPFNKLKTLVLSKWFLSTDLSALIWFLHHTPLLEKLTLEFPETLMTAEGGYNPLEKSIAPSHLQNVEIKCKYVDGIILKVLKVLNANGIPQGKIRIQCSGYNFACTDINKWK